ncbi:hypothetical protein [Cupriavidus campinensis]
MKKPDAFDTVLDYACRYAPHLVVHLPRRRYGFRPALTLMLAAATAIDAPDPDVRRRCACDADTLLSLAESYGWADRAALTRLLAAGQHAGAPAFGLAEAAVAAIPAGHLRDVLTTLGL